MKEITFWFKMLLNLYILRCPKNITSQINLYTFSYTVLKFISPKRLTKFLKLIVLLRVVKSLSRNNNPPDKWLTWSYSHDYLRTMYQLQYSNNL